MWRHIMLTGAYIAGDNYNDLYSLLGLLLIHVIFDIDKFAPYNGEHYSKNCRRLKNTGGSLAAKVDHLWQQYLVQGGHP